MLNVGARELRLNLTHYLDLLEQGKEIVIIRNSQAIGRLVPNEDFVKPEDIVDNSYIMTTAKEVKFRRFKQYENSEPLMKLHRTALEAVGSYVDNPNLDRDLLTPSMFYGKMNGELWVGKVGDEIIVMGGFIVNLMSDNENQAILKRMRVKPDMQNSGLGAKMLGILIERMKDWDYKSVILDVTDKPGQAAARHLYEKFGFREYKRERANSFNIIFMKKVL